MSEPATNPVGPALAEVFLKQYQVGYAQLLGLIDQTDPVQMRLAEREVEALEFQVRRLLLFRRGAA